MSYINLSGTHLGDDDLVTLDGLSDVDVLDLSDTLVTDAGLKHLKRLTRLQVLVVDGTRVTESGVDDIRRALPGLSIVMARYSIRIDRAHAGSPVLSIPAASAGRGGEFIPFYASGME